MDTEGLSRCVLVPVRPALFHFAEILANPCNFGEF